MLADLSSLPSRMNFVFSQGGYPIGSPDPSISYWAIKMDTGKWRCELDQVQDLLIGKRNLDWSLDIASTEDWKHITELWMVCPPTSVSLSGNTARLPISQPGTAFQLKVGVMDSNLGQSLRRPLAQIVGHVTDQETGDCECFVFDYGAQALITFEQGKDNEGHPIYGPWKTNVYNMGAWRPTIPGQPSVAPIGRLSFPVLGLHFGDRLKYEDEHNGGDIGKAGD